MIRHPDPVPVALPKGLQPEFALAIHELGADFARAGIVKDAGDDPDVTHGALIVATVRLAPPGSGVSFKAGAGVGAVTRPGLPLKPGEPAINPAPRAMIRANLEEVAARLGVDVDATVEISVPGGKKACTYQGYLMAQILSYSAKTGTYAYKETARLLSNILATRAEPIETAS